MGKRTKLLATVALPLVSMILQPVQAAPLVMPTVAIDAASNVIEVQAKSQMSEEDIRRLRRQAERQRGGDQSQQRDDNRKNAREDRRQVDRQKERDAAARKSAADRKAAADAERARDARARKDAAAERARDAKTRRDREAATERRREERRKEIQADRQRERKQQVERDRRRDAEARRDQVERERRRDAEARRDQVERDRRRDAKARRDQVERERRRDAETRRDQVERERRREAETRRDQAERRKAVEERRVQERRDDQAERDRRLRERREAERDRRRPVDQAQRSRRERDEARERIARDPSRIIDTIELPLVGGAAVLDSDKDWDNRRDMSREELRRRRAEERRNVEIRVPTSDADAQINRRRAERYESIERERGTRIDRRPGYRERDGLRVERRLDDRVLLNFDDRFIVRSDDRRRLSRRATETYYEELSGGRVREVIERPNGDRIFTIRNRYGEILQRSRITASGREDVMFYAPEFDREARPTFEDPGRRLPPMRLAIPVSEYIVDTSSDDIDDYREFLERPPVESVERVYSLDEVKYSARIRDKVRRIDLDTITFATGSAEISMGEAATLRRVADAMMEILNEDPGETFLIEGHTDAVGSDESNLILSDERAESVADVLTDVFDIPPENLATQGYGERFLKIATEGPEQLNRRVTIRRVTPLVKPVASLQ